MNLPRRLKVVNSSKTVIALYFLLTTGYIQEPYLVIEIRNKVSYGWAYIRVTPFPQGLLSGIQKLTMLSSVIASQVFL